MVIKIFHPGHLLNFNCLCAAVRQDCIVRSIPAGQNEFSLMNCIQNLIRLHNWLSLLNSMRDNAVFAALLWYRMRPWWKFHLRRYIYIWINYELFDIYSRHNRIGRYREVHTFSSYLLIIFRYHSNSKHPVSLFAFDRPIEMSQMPIWLKKWQ